MWSVPVTQSSEPPLSAVAISNIRAEAARRGLSHRQLAQRTGVTPEYFSRRMRGEVPLGLDELAVIAAALGLSPESLLARTDVLLPRAG